MVDAATNLDNVERIDGDGEHEETAEITLIDTPKLRKTVRAALNKIEDAKNIRKSINDEIAAELAKLAVLGISRHAAKEALRRMNLNEDQRRARDASYAFCLKALDIGYQAGLFDEPDPK